MDRTSLPFELISYRGLLKSFDEIKRGNFMLPNNGKSKNDSDDENNENGDKTPNTFLFIGKNKTNMLNSIKNVLIFSVFTLINYVEKFLFILMSGYDDYVYSPMQKYLSPICRLIPRYIYAGSNRKIPIFTANIITLSRTFLVVPIAWFLKYDYNMAAFLCVVFHDFLDHLDGIVAKVQRVTYPNHDDPLLGGFLDAFCDKIVNVLSIWTIMQTANYDASSTLEKCVCLFLCYAVIAYETVIGIVRVDDFFNAQFKKRYNIVEEEANKQPEDANKVTMASMEGKLKEKLESTGIAFLCMAIAKTNPNQITNCWGIAGLICLLLTLRMAHKSLALKLKNRVKKTHSNAKSGAGLKYKRLQSVSAEDLVKLEKQEMNKRRDDDDETSADDIDESHLVSVQMKMIDLDEEDHKQVMKEKRPQSEDEEKNESSYGFMNYKRPMRKLCHKSDADALPDNESKKTTKKIDKAAKSNIDKAKNSDTESEEYDKEEEYGFEDSSESEKNENDERVDKVYTIGCFDLFHHGHIMLLQRMRQYGRRVIVGVHDSRSIYKLKKRVPVDSTEKRMLNVKAYADEVFCVAGTDPSNFISSIVSLRKNETAYYIRGNDMPDFPSKNLVESLMPIKLLPYTSGVSSTKLRKEKFSHIKPNDQEYLEKNS